MLTLRLEPQPTVGDWIAFKDGEVVAVLPRRSLLRRRNAHGDGEQQLAANIDKVLLVCGLDRPVKDGRIQRGTAISRDAGAEPVVVLTKASRDGASEVDPQQAADEVRAAHPGIDVIVTSVKEGIGIDELRSIIGNDTVTLLGESGAGKSSIVNALLGDDVVTIGDVRESDSKGRHTTTTRELHLLPGGGVLIDSPGIRAVGLVADNDGVAETFADVDDIASLIANTKANPAVPLPRRWPMEPSTRNELRPGADSKRKLTQPNRSLPDRAHRLDDLVDRTKGKPGRSSPCPANDTVGVDHEHRASVETDRPENSIVLRNLFFDVGQQRKTETAVLFCELDVIRN
jgi:ribosome small subunit-dependent GTPase A